MGAGGAVLYARKEVRAESQRTLAAARRRLWMCTAVTMAVGAGVVAVDAVRLRRPPAPEPRPAPRAAGAYATGGAPPLAAVVERAFTADLPDWVVALNAEIAAAAAGDGGAYRRAVAAKRAARDALLSDAVRAALGADAAARVGDLLSRAEACGRAREGPPLDRASAALLDAVSAANDAFVAAGVGLFVDADVVAPPGGPRRVLLFSFRVVHVALHRDVSPPIRVLHVRKLDDLNWSRPLLGFASDHFRDAVVLLDQVDAALVSDLLPAMAPGARIDLYGDGDAATEDRRAVEERAGAIVRAEYTAALGDRARQAARVGALLAARRDLFAQWNRRLAGTGARLAAPRTLRVRDVDALLADLAPVASEPQRRQLADIERALTAAPAVAAVDAARRVLVAAVERHEVRHRLDARGAPRPVPPALAAYVGPERDGRGRARPIAQVAREEMSAYLAGIARDPATPLTSFTLLCRFAFDPDRWGAAETYAALAIVAELAREIGIAIDGPLIERGVVRRDRVARAYLALTERGAAELAAAAERAWRAAFGSALAPAAPPGSSAASR
ncbi:MAG: hypothetical protein D6689_15850 [Deltaproteobacteria bacterium]|nr:MAG: hypothetical protein D6689_15850 [Deltaproteobacteria bacterium]